LQVGQSPTGQPVRQSLTRRYKVTKASCPLEADRPSPDGGGDLRRAEVGTVLLGHTRAGMAEVLGDHEWQQLAATAKGRDSSPPLDSGES